MGMFVAHSRKQQEAWLEQRRASARMRRRADGSWYDCRTGKDVVGPSGVKVRRQSLSDYKAMMARLRPGSV